MNRFTQEYIELCKSEKVQGLKKKYYQGDWIIPKDKKMMVNIFDGIERLDYLWLPTGDQLDDEIVKICGIKKVSYGYNPGLRHNASGNEYYYASIKSYIPDELGIFITNFDNPLIAKIQLLINLLEE